MPVRRPQNHFGRHLIGSFFSVKMQRGVLFESTIERDLFQLLDFDPDVIEYHEQPLVIPYQLGSRSYTYVPDVLITYRNGRKVLGECKAERFADTVKVQRKVRAGEIYCQYNGLEYRLFKEPDIRSGYRLKNLQLMHQFARYDFDEDIQKQIAHVRSVTQGIMSIDEFASQFSSERPQDFFYVALKLLYIHHLDSDIDFALLSPDTKIWFTDLGG